MGVAGPRYMHISSKIEQHAAGAARDAAASHAVLRTEREAQKQNVHI